jgi:hypothetical protein
MGHGKRPCAIFNPKNGLLSHKSSIFVHFI